MKYHFCSDYKEKETSFWVFSDLANIDFLVVLDDPSRKQEAMEIADKAMSDWFELDECYSGHVEYVQEALEEEEIEAKYYSRV